MNRRRISLRKTLRKSRNRRIIPGMSRRRNRPKRRWMIRKV